MRGPNWKNIKKLRDHLAALKTTKHRKFDMSDYIKITSLPKGYKKSYVTVEQARANSPACGTADCLFGETFILFAPKKAKIVFEDFENGAMSPAQLLEDHGETITASALAIDRFVEKKLGLSGNEGYHMASGAWAFKNDWFCEQVRELSSITRKEALRYLDKVLKERNVMVTIY